ncbi:MAG: hypothetical protein IKA02_06540, partial [Clostridia bacterium]|nr:hypothetical protein [Clostridia bacterium]
IRRIKEFLGDVYYYNEEKSREEAYGKTDTPISVCLTMLDVLKDAYTDMEIGLRHYFRPSTYQNDYNIHRFLNHELPGKNKNLINQFIGWEESNFVNYINNNFGKNQFFGISALGTNDENLGIDMEYDFKPINVLDPFVWFIDEVAPELLENDENFKRLD